MKLNISVENAKLKVSVTKSGKNLEDNRFFGRFFERNYGWDDQYFEVDLENKFFKEAEEFLKDSYDWSKAQDGIMDDAYAEPQDLKKALIDEDFPSLDQDKIQKTKEKFEKIIDQPMEGWMKKAGVLQEPEPELSKAFHDAEKVAKKAWENLAEETNKTLVSVPQRLGKLTGLQVSDPDISKELERDLKNSEPVPIKDAEVLDSIFNADCEKSFFLEGYTTIYKKGTDQS